MHHHFFYDAASRIIGITDVDGSTDYTYDKTNQLTGADPTAPDRTNESYTYDANGNRTNANNANYQTGGNNQLTSDGIYTYTYDDEGNLKTRTKIGTSEVRTFTWDYRNRLVGVTDSVHGTTTYTYDVMDRRIAKTAPGSTTQFVYDGDNIILEFNGTVTPSVRYLQGPGVDQVLAQEKAGATSWMLTDHLGTVRDLVNNNGGVVNHFTYDSFGKVLTTMPGGTDTRYKFTGRELDAETGLYYYRARYFDANIGRFIGQDPIGFDAGDSNLYRYVGNSPLMATDPSGNYKILIEYDKIAKYGHHARVVFERKNGLRIVYEASPLKAGSKNAISNTSGSAGSSGFLIPEPNTFGKPKYNTHPQNLTQFVYEDKECEDDWVIEQPIRNTFLALLKAKIEYSSLYRNSNSAAFQALENTFLENDLPGKARPQPKGKLWVPAWEINPFTGKVSPFAVPRDYDRTKVGTPIRSQPRY